MWRGGAHTAREKPGEVNIVLLVEGGQCLKKLRTLSLQHFELLPVHVAQAPTKTHERECERSAFREKSRTSIGNVR